MKKIAIIAASAALLLACAKDKQVQKGAVTASAGLIASTTQLPPGHPAVPATAAVAVPQQQAAPASANVLAGKVDETMNAAGYTYVRIGDKWAAVRQTNVKKGDKVTIAVQMVAENFESKTLNRKFDKIIFGEIGGGARTAPAAQQPPAAMANAMGTPAEHMKPSVDPGAIKVERAPDGKTVADVWALKAVMKDQPVVVRGKVVKFLPGIMGKNWMHLRDGSGSRANGDDDITVTTNEMVKVGDVVTISGTVRVDKDFGAGYMYPVIIEDAKTTH